MLAVLKVANGQREVPLGVEVRSRVVVPQRGLGDAKATMGCSTKVVCTENTAMEDFRIPA